MMIKLPKYQHLVHIEWLPHFWPENQPAENQPRSAADQVSSLCNTTELYWLFIAFFR